MLHQGRITKSFTNLASQVSEIQKIFWCESSASLGKFAPTGLTARRYAARPGRFAATAICRYAANRSRDREREKRGEKRGEEELYPLLLYCRRRRFAPDLFADMTYVGGEEEREKKS